LSRPYWKYAVVGRPSGLTEPENPALPSVTAVGELVSTGVGDPGDGGDDGATELNVAVTFVSAPIVTSQVPVPEQPPPHPANVDPEAVVAMSVTWVPTG
jgi:hypothetical protein